MKTERDILHDAGLKATLPRLYVVRELLLAKAQQQRLNATDIYHIIIRRGEQISLAAVYRVLQQLEKSKLVVRYQFHQGSLLYQLSTSAHHNHMICETSGEVIEFESQILEQLQKELAAKLGFDIVYSQRIVYIRKRPT